MKRTLIIVAVSMLEDAVFYLSRTPESAYTQQVKRLSGASVGALSYRYISNFMALADALRKSQFQQGIVLNYECHPCPQAVMHEPALASQYVKALIEALPQLMHLEVSWLENTTLLSEKPVLIPTSFERELLWAIENTLHYFAMIKIGLSAVAPCIELPGHFGESPALNAQASQRLQLYRTRPLSLPLEKLMAV